MAKKKKQGVSTGVLAGGVAALFALAAICMLFVNAVSVAAGDNVLMSFTGLQVAFGYSETTSVPLVGELTAKILDFSFMNLLPYLLALGGLVVVLLNLNGKSFLLNVIALACFVAAAVFFFTAHAYVVTASDMVNTYAKDSFTLAIGSILGGVFSIIAAIGAGAKILLK